MEVIRAFAPIRRLTDWKLQNLITEKYSRLFDGTKMPVSANGTIWAFVRAEQFFPACMIERAFTLGYRLSSGWFAWQAFRKL